MKYFIVFLLISFNTYLYSQENILKFQNVSYNSINDYFLKPKIKDSTYNSSDTSLISNGGELKKIIEYFKNGIKYKTIGFFANGKKFRETYFNKMGRHGKDTKWFYNGNIETQMYLKNNKFIYPILSWFEDETLKEIDELENEKGIGYKKEWFINGNLKEEVLYIDTSKKGFILRDYYETGDLKSLRKSNLGKQTYVFYFPNKQKLLEGEIFDAIWNQVGHWQEWQENGVKSRDYYFHDSIPNQREGTWKWFDEKGNLIREEYYKNGEKTGEKEFMPELKKKQLEKKK